MGNLAKKYLFLLICVWSIFNDTNAWAQSDQVFFQHITVEDGLPQGTILDIYQDEKGLIWIASMSGLTLYDGYSFKNFAHSPSDSTSLADNYIRAITEVKWPNGDHQIWAGTATSGISALDYNLGTFQSILLNAENYSPSANNRITVLQRDSTEKGYVWVGTSQKGLIRISLETGQQDQVLKSSEVIGSISTILFDRAGKLWIGTSRAGIFLVNNPYDSITDLNPKSVGKTIDPRVSAILQEDENHLWIGTYNGLNLFNLHNMSIVEEHKYHPDLINSLAHNEVTKLLKDISGNVWIGTSKNGLNRLDPRTGEFRHYKFNPGLPSSLTENRILSLMQDRDGILWIGTNKGISTLSETDPFFEMMVHEPGNESSLTINRVKSVYQDTVHNGIWVGTFGGGLNFANSTTKKVTRFQPDPADSFSIGSDAIFSILQRKETPNDIWLGTFGGGLERLGFTSKQFTQFRADPTDSTSILSDQVYDLTEDDFGNFWIATGVGICKYNTNGTFERYFSHQNEDRSNAERLPIFPTYVIEPDGEYLWLGTIYNGVVRYHIPTNESVHFVNDPQDQMSLSNNRVKSLLKDSEGNLWVGNDAGLDLFNPSSNNFIRYQPVIRVPDAQVVGILEGRSAELWLSTNNGLIYFNPADSTIRRFRKAQGLPGNEYNRGALSSDNGRYIVFGAVDGVTYFDKEKIPPPAVKAIDLAITLLGLTADGDTLNEHRLVIEDDYVFNFTPDIGSYTISFTAQNYANAQNISFRYRIKGVRDKWIEVKKGINYLTVGLKEPGDYQLEIQAGFQRNFKGSVSKIINYHVQAEFFELWWVQFGIVFIILFYAFTRSRNKTKKNEEVQKMLLTQVAQRTKQYTDQNIILRSEIQERKEVEEALKVASAEATAASEAKGMFLANMSHEIRTPLNGILGMIDLLEDTPLDEMQKDHVETLNSSSLFLMRLLNDILDFSKMEANQLALEKISFNLHRCVEETVGLMSRPAGGKKIELLYTIDKQVPEVVIGDQVRYRQVLTNLISNAIKFTSIGEVVIKITAPKIKDNSYYIKTEIKDSGIGIDPTKAANLFNKFSQADSSTTRKFGGTGLGLAICKKLAELLGGEINATGEIGKGSTFDFSLPFEKDQHKSKDLTTFKPFTGQNILVLESHPLVRDQIMAFCDAWSLSPQSGISDSEINQVIRGLTKIDAVILDQNHYETFQEQLTDIPVKIVLAPLAWNMIPPAGYILEKRPLNPKKLHTHLSKILEAKPNIKTTNSPIKKVAAEQKSHKPNPLRILLAEDNAVNRKVVCYLLDRAGYENVDIAENGLEALEAVQKNQYDVILMDMHMPVMDGLEAAEKIIDFYGLANGNGEIHPPAKIIALTASTMEEDKKRCSDAGMEGFLTKPIEKAALMAALDEV